MERRQEELDDEQAPQPGGQVASAEGPAADALMPMEIATNPAADLPAAGAASGPSALVIGGVALGAVGFAAAASGGGGGKSGDPKPPVVEVPKPEIRRPQPEPPKPDDGHQPAPETPKPDNGQKPLPPTPDHGPPPAPETPKPGDGQSPRPNVPKPDVEQPGSGQPGKPETPETPANPDIVPPPEPEKPTTPAPQPPPPPTIALLDDSGFGGEDKVTNNPTLQVGNIAAATIWKYSIDGGEWEIGTGGRIPAAEFFGVETLHHARVKQIDSAGIESAITEFSFRLDTKAPDQVTAEAAGGLVASGEHIEIGAEAGAAWEYSFDDGAHWHQGKSSGQLDASDIAVPNGSATVTFRQIDLAGNVSETSTLDFTVNKAGAPNLSLRNDNGASSADRVTSDATVVVEGLAQGSGWKYSLDSGQTWVAGRADGIIAPKTFGYLDGTKSVWVKAVDGSGADGAMSSLEFSLVANVVQPEFSGGDTGTLAGSVGADRFTFGKKKYDVEGFNVDEADVIDLNELIVVEPGRTITDYIRVVVRASDSKGIEVGETSISVTLPSHHWMVPVLYEGNVFFV